MKLTERELDVLACVLVGEKSYQLVAEILDINKSTVNTYVRRVLNKAKCSDVADLKEYIWIDDDLEYRYKELIEGSNSYSHRKILTIGIIIALNIFTIILTLKAFG